MAKMVFFQLSPEVNPSQQDMDNFRVDVADLMRHGIAPMICPPGVTVQVTDVGDGLLSLVYADWLEENGYADAATAFRRRFCPPTPG